MEFLRREGRRGGIQSDPGPAQLRTPSGPAHPGLAAAGMKGRRKARPSYKNTCRKRPALRRSRATCDLARAPRATSDTIPARSWSGTTQHGSAESADITDESGDVPTCVDAWYSGHVNTKTSGVLAAGGSPYTSRPDATRSRAGRRAATHGTAFCQRPSRAW